MSKKLLTIFSLCLLVLISSCADRPAKTLLPVNPPPLAADARPLIIDTDMAADDWLAILYLLMRPDVDVKAITVTGAGEAHCGQGTRNARNLLALAGRPDIPVTCGREKPLEGTHAFPQAWREAVDNLLGLELAESTAPVSDECAADFLAQIVLDSPRKVQVVTLGPLTNLAKAIATHPDLVNNLEMVTIMGGAVRVPGNVGESSEIDNEVAEWNIYVDPSAAAQVFASGAPISLVPLDATNRVPLTSDFFKRLQKDRSNSIAEFAYRVLAAQEQNINSGHYYFWDPLAAAIASQAELATFEEMRLSVIEDENPQSGQTLESPQGFPVRVATGADPERFETLFLDVLNGRIP